LFFAGVPDGFYGNIFACLYGKVLAVYIITEIKDKNEKYGG